MLASAGQNVSWLALGDIWQAKAAQPMQAKTRIFLCNGQFWVPQVRIVPWNDTCAHIPMDLHHQQRGAE